MSRENIHSRKSQKVFVVGFITSLVSWSFYGISFLIIFAKMVSSSSLRHECAENLRRRNGEKVGKGSGGSRLTEDDYRRTGEIVIVSDFSNSTWGLK